MAGITTAMVAGYRASVNMLVQRKGGIFRPYVINEFQDTEFEYFDRLGPIEANEILVDGSDTVYSDQDHDRVANYLRDYDVASKITKQSQIRTLADFQGPYAVNQSNGMMRKMDVSIVNAFFADTKTGKSGATTTTWAGDGGQTVAVNYVTPGDTVSNTNLTVAKLRKAREYMLANELRPEDEPWYIAITSSQLTSLLETTEIGSVDYNPVRALYDGVVNRFMGFNFIYYEGLTTDSNSYREIPVWAGSGMLFGHNNVLDVYFDRMPGKRQLLQVYVSGSWGVTRLEGKKVVKILCNEA